MVVMVETVEKQSKKLKVLAEVPVDAGLICWLVGVIRCSMSTTSSATKAEGLTEREKQHSKFLSDHIADCKFNFSISDPAGYLNSK